MAPASTLLIMFVSGALIPASVIGARILNAGGTSTLSITTEAAVALLAPVIILHRRELPSLCLAWALSCQCLALLLLTSLRGTFISGHDILYEFAIFKTTLVHSHWSMLYAHNPYNACLSLTILPVLLVRDVPGLLGENVFRIIYPVLCSLVPVGAFAIARRFVSPRHSYIAGFLFMVSAFLTLHFPYISRQEVGLFFFMAILLAMAVPPSEGRSRQVIVPTLAFGLIVSHYSTAYTAVAIMAVAVVVQFAIGQLRREPVKFRAGFVTWWLTGLLTVGVILWQAVLTRATGDIGAFVDAATKSFGGSGSVFAGTPPYHALLNDFLRSKMNATCCGAHPVTYTQGSYASYHPAFRVPQVRHSSLSPLPTKVLLDLGKMARLGCQALMIVGCAFLLAQAVRRRIPSRYRCTGCRRCRRRPGRRTHPRRRAILRCIAPLPTSLGHLRVGIYNHGR